jgi:DNA-binding transcriptional MocR family regulator
MWAPGDRSLGLAGVRPWADDVVRAPRVRERVNERFLANTLRGVGSANARAEAQRQILPDPRVSRAGGERPGGAVEDEAAVGKKRRRHGDDAAGKHAVDDPSASPADVTGFAKDVASDERLAALLNRAVRRRGGVAARPTGGYALIPELASAAADDLRSRLGGAVEKPSEKVSKKKKRGSKKKRKKEERKRRKTSSRGD